MAQSFPVGHPLQVNRWAKGLNAVVLNAISFRHFIGKGPRAIVCEKDELKSRRGNRLRFGLRGQLSADGVTGRQVLEGQEEEYDTYYDDLYVNNQRHATRVGEGIDPQHVEFEVREEGRMALGDWWQERLETVRCNHMCGYTPIESLPNPDAYNGQNTITDYDSNHALRWDVSGSTTLAGDENLDLAGTDEDIFTLQHVDIAVEMAQTRDFPIRTGTFNGQELYVCEIHTYSVTDLRDSNSQWYAQNQAALQGGYLSKNPIISGSLGVHNGCLILGQRRITQGVNSSTGVAISGVRRNVFYGAQSGLLGFAREGAQNRFRWVEVFHDYEEELGIAARLIWGFKRSEYNGETYGSILIPCSAAAAV